MNQSNQRWNAIDAISNVSSLLKFVTEEMKVSHGSILGLSVGPDNKRSSINIVHLSQTGIGLPDRDYYFKTDSSTIAIQNAYKNYVSSLLQLTGADAATAQKSASTAYEIEKQFASVHKTNIERRDVKANYNKLAVTAISKKHPNLNWTALLNDLGIKTDSVNMRQPAYYDKLDAMLKSVSINDWKAYLKANTLTAYANFLSQPFVDASFEYAKILTGQAVKKTRAEEMTQAVDRSLGQALAQLYGEEVFS